MNKSTIDKNIVINGSILDQVVRNLHMNHEAGMISDARLKELRGFGIALASELGDQVQIVMDGSCQLAPHVFQAIKEIRKIDKSLLPRPILVK